MSMELLLQRISTGDESTLGILFRSDDTYVPTHQSFRCFTMEDQPNEPKVPGETRIPAGSYQIELRTEGGMHNRYSDKFEWHRGMLWLQDVPGFTWVYLHYGNYEKDTDGCILTGDGAQSNVLEDGMVMSSVAAYTRLYAEIIDAMQFHDGGPDAGAEVWITIEDFA